jgi:hypothetical protein
VFAFGVAVLAAFRSHHRSTELLAPKSPADLSSERGCLHKTDSDKQVLQATSLVVPTEQPAPRGRTARIDIAAYGGSRLATNRRAGCNWNAAATLHVHRAADDFRATTAAVVSVPHLFADGDRYAFDDRDIGRAVHRCAARRAAGDTGGSTTSVASVRDIGQSEYQTEHQEGDKAIHVAFSQG